MNNFFNSIFSKKPEQTQNDVPKFNITENAPQKCDFEVIELTFEEFARFVVQQQ